MEFDLTTWTVTYIAHSTYGDSSLDGVCARLIILTTTKTNLKFSVLNFLPS
jgi:hypothetical protein